MSLSLIWEGITIAISHTPNWLKSGFDHIEVKSDELIPITETNYRSCFLPMHELALFKGPEDFVRQWLDLEDGPKYRQRLAESKQLTLF